MLAFHPQKFVRVEDCTRSPRPGPPAPGERVDAGAFPPGAGRLQPVRNLRRLLRPAQRPRENLWFIRQRHLRFAGLHDTAAHPLDPQETAPASAAD
ncbi:hypothetical protein HNQ09_002015 [Deinococcus budaensis]|uniref:Uncharacterized protein n=1 Tax=Deinococcus budaensis TaxID=1665626 RepID=A0A7W8LQG3_9DEIO|nr:hypothetical protein [Deinococcus budaensis]